MRLTLQKVFDVTRVLATIINESRPMPLKGAYRLARLHAKLKPEFDVVSTKRDELIMAYDHHEMVPGPQSKEDPLGQILVPSPQFSVPPAKQEEFAKAWTDLAKEEIDIDVPPMPLSQFDPGPGKASPLTALELSSLGDLIVDDTAG